MHINQEYTEQYERANKLLAKRYCELYETGCIPQNAWKVCSSNVQERYVRSAIPFIGKEYFSLPKGYRILLYASAENLSNYGDNIDLLAGEDRVYRCRQSFEESIANEKFFPSVHIQPINDGGLLIVAYQIVKRLLGDRAETMFGSMAPAEFLEHICCANFGKFTLHVGDGKTNYDYAKKKDIGSISFSHEYVKADIELLRPDIIILPNGMYHDARQKELFFDKYFPDPDFQIIPVYQINPTVVNCNIHKMYPEKRLEELTANELMWHKNIKRINRRNFLSVYTYIESVVSKCTVKESI